jgi:hypothetical protein
VFPGFSKCACEGRLAPRRRTQVQRDWLPPDSEHSTGVDGLAQLSAGRQAKTNSRQITPKHHGKPAIIRDQRTRPVNKIDNLAKSAKPPSPVQIRAAPPFFLENLTIPPLLRRAARLQLFSNVLRFGHSGATPRKRQNGLNLHV